MSLRPRCALCKAIALVSAARGTRLGTNAWRVGVSRVPARASSADATYREEGATACASVTPARATGTSSCAIWVPSPESTTPPQKRRKSRERSAAGTKPIASPACSAMVSLCSYTWLLCAPGTRRQGAGGPVLTESGRPLRESHLFDQASMRHNHAAVSQHVVPCVGPQSASVTVNASQYTSLSAFITCGDSCPRESLRVPGCQAGHAGDSIAYRQPRQHPSV